MAAALTSATSGGTFANDATVGTIDWDTPSNASASDDTRASAVLLITEVTKYLKATNFGFNIPTGSTIRGIVVEVEKSSVLGTTIEDNSVKIVKGGTIGGTEQKAAGAWGTTDAYTTYGSATDLWGVTWTAEDINLSTFGVVVAADATAAGTARIDHIRITIHYSNLQMDFAYNLPNFAASNNLPVISQGTIRFIGFNFPGSISLRTINFNVNGSDANRTLSLLLGLYSLNGNTLSLANSISGTVRASQNGLYFLPLTATSSAQNITPGTWYFGLLCTISSNTNLSFRGITLSTINNAFPGAFYAGLMTDSTSALPASYATSDLDITGGDEVAIPMILLSA